MHELSVCMSLLEQVSGIADERGAVRVTRIELNVGPLSGIEPELLQNAYPIAAIGTLAEHAELVIRKADIIVRCSQCNAETRASPNRLACGACGGLRTSMISGDEMILKSVELEAE